MRSSWHLPPLLLLLLLIKTEAMSDAFGVTLLHSIPDMGGNGKKTHHRGRGMLDSMSPTSTTQFYLRGNIAGVAESERDTHSSDPLSQNDAIADAATTVIQNTNGTTTTTNSTNITNTTNATVVLPPTNTNTTATLSTAPSTPTSSISHSTQKPEEKPSWGAAVFPVWFLVFLVFELFIVVQLWQRRMLYPLGMLPPMLWLLPHLGVLCGSLQALLTFVGASTSILVASGNNSAYSNLAADSPMLIAGDSSSKYLVYPPTILVPFAADEETQDEPDDRQRLTTTFCYGISSLYFLFQCLFTSSFLTQTVFMWYYYHLQQYQASNSRDRMDSMLSESSGRINFKKKNAGSSAASSKTGLSSPEKGEAKRAKASPKNANALAAGGKAQLLSSTTSAQQPHAATTKGVAVTSSSVGTSSSVSAPLQSAGGQQQTRKLSVANRLIMSVTEKLKPEPVKTNTVSPQKAASRLAPTQPQQVKNSHKVSPNQNVVGKAAKIQHNNFVSCLKKRCCKAKSGTSKTNSAWKKQPRFEHFSQTITNPSAPAVLDQYKRSARVVLWTTYAATLLFITLPSSTVFMLEIFMDKEASDTCYPTSVYARLLTSITVPAVCTAVWLFDRRMRKVTDDTFAMRHVFKKISLFALLVLVPIRIWNIATSFHNVSWDFLGLNIAFCGYVYWFGVAPLAISYAEERNSASLLRIHSLLQQEKKKKSASVVFRKTAAKKTDRTTVALKKAVKAKEKKAKEPVKGVSNCADLFKALFQHGEGEDEGLMYIPGEHQKAEIDEFEKYLVKEFCVENAIFLRAVRKFKIFYPRNSKDKNLGDPAVWPNLDAMWIVASRMCESFISVGSSHEININAQSRAAILLAVSQKRPDRLVEGLAKAEQQVLQMCIDPFNRYLRAKQKMLEKAADANLKLDKAKSAPLLSVDSRRPSLQVVPIRRRRSTKPRVPPYLPTSTTAGLTVTPQALSLVGQMGDERKTRQSVGPRKSAATATTTPPAEANKTPGVAGPNNAGKEKKQSNTTATNEGVASQSSARVMAWSTNTAKEGPKEVRGPTNVRPQQDAAAAQQTTLEDI